MQLRLARSMWGVGAPLEAVLRETADAGFDAVEGPSSVRKSERSRVRRLLADEGLGWIAEVTTGGGAERTADWWIPSPFASVDDHLADLALGVEHAVDMGAWFVSAMGGYDAWTLSQHVDFFGRALALERASGIPISFETHRSRSLFNPWVTRDLLHQLPSLKLTCDYSHWCVVAERLIDSEGDILDLCASRALHVHARVGWAQGAQVSDPRESRFRPALEAHERWWEEIWAAQEEGGLGLSTMTVEWGPDGYAPIGPEGDSPAVDLWEIVRWMAHRQRTRFAEWKDRRKVGMESAVQRALG